MKKNVLCFLLFSIFIFADLKAQVIRGILKNEVTQEPAYAVSIHVKNSTEGTYSDDRGRFQLTVKKKLPITLIVSSIGFETKEVPVPNFGAVIEITLKPTSILGQEVVVSASRVVQKKKTILSGYY
ncbi:carboxypeptidase-like regulatory domain-containing protein [Pedobacter sp. NJ-S-72]